MIRYYNEKNSLYLLSFTDAIEMELDEWYDKKSSELLFHLLSRKKLKRKNGDILKYEWIIPKNIKVNMKKFGN